MSDLSHEAPPVNEGLELLNRLEGLAPFSPLPVGELKEKGWDHFYGYRENNQDGSPNTDHLRLVVDKITREVKKDVWDLCRAEDGDEQGHKDHVRTVLKKLNEEGERRSAIVSG